VGARAELLGGFKANALSNKMRYTYTCPVCAYPAMTEPVEEGNICPCCGTEFGYDDDLEVTYTQLRARWLQGGALWFSHVVPAPITWDPILQLLEADLDPEELHCDDVTSTSNTEVAGSQAVA